MSDGSVSVGAHVEIKILPSGAFRHRQSKRMCVVGQYVRKQ